LSKAKIFILVWGVLLALFAILFYVYVTMFGKPRLGKLNIFAPDSEQSASANGDFSWFGKLSGDKDLYPAKEAELHIDLGESEKSFIITVENLTTTSLKNLELELQNNGIEYTVAETKNGFKVDIDSPDKEKMNAKLAIVKSFNLSSKN
jgi:hypothetical protein